MDCFGGNDGSWGSIKYFDCKPHKGKFVLLHSLKPDQRIIKGALLVKFTFTLPYHVIIIAKSSESNTQSGGVDDCHNEAVLTPDNIQLVDTNPYNLEVGSVIEYGQQCGVIKWIGKLPDHTEVIAGLEMVKHVTITLNTCIVTLS